MPKTLKKRTEFTENDFFHRLKSNDPVLLNQVIEQYSEEVYRAARGQGFNETQAKDLVQDVFETFLKTLDRFEGRSHIRTWIFGILYHKAMEARRKIFKINKEDDIDEIFENQFDPSGHWIQPPLNPDEFKDRAQKQNLIETCFKQLPENQKQAFYYKEVVGLKTSEICKILAVSVTNLGVLLYRARNRLRTCIERCQGA